MASVEASRILRKLLHGGSGRCARFSYSASTIGTYRATIRKIQGHTGCTLEIPPSDGELVSLIDRILNDGGRSAVRQCLRILMVCHRVWGDGHHIKRVHIPRAPVHATRSRQTRGICKAQIEALWRGCRCTLDRLLLELTTTTAARINALRKLQVSDVTEMGDTQCRIWVVALTEKGGKVHVEPLTTSAVTRIRQLEATYGDDGYVFRSPRSPYNGAPVGVSSMRERFHRLADCSSIQQIPPHAARHMVAHNLLLESNPVKQISKFLGHPSTQTSPRTNSSKQ